MRRLIVSLLVLVLVGLVPGGAGAADSVTRSQGATRIQTAIALAQRAFPTSGSADAVVVARDRDFADALAAAPLAVAAGGPVLLNPREGLDPDVQAEIERLGADTVYLMGGTAAQSTEVERALKEDTAGVVQVIRVQDPDHPDRFGTAAEAARRSASLWGGSAGDHVLIALGSHPDPSRAWPDALSAGQLAGHARRPILLVQPSGVPAATQEALSDLGTTTATVIGGTAAVPQSVADELSVATVRRIGGDTRYDTARLVADAADAAGGNLATILVTTGTNYADGLAAGPAAVHLGAVMLLVHPGHLAESPHAHDWLADHHATIGDVIVAGGPTAVSDPVLDQIAGATSGTGELTLRWEPVVTGLSSPVAVESAPGDGRLFVVEQGGIVWATYPDGGKVVFLDIRDRVNVGGERGLLGLAFHPQYANNGRFFVYYTRKGTNDTRLAEYRAVGGEADGNEAVLDDIAQPYSNHNGGGLEFAPDGTLWLALGDGGSSNDPQGNGQNTSTPLGALLRYSVGGQAGSWTAPADNPFAQEGGDRRIAHYGLRNPFRFSFDPIDQRVLIGDVGEDAREEIDAVGIASLGRNFGWACREGTIAGPQACTGSFTEPVHDYADGSGTCAVTGGVVYRGHDLPELAGTYLYADYCEGSLRSFRLTDAGAAVEKRTWTGVGAGNPSGFGTDSRGEVYVTDLAGGTDLAGRLLQLVRG